MRWLIPLLIGIVVVSGCTFQENNEIPQETIEGPIVEESHDEDLEETINEEPETDRDKLPELKVVEKESSTVKEENKRIFRIEIPSGKEREQLPECDDLKFSTFPVDMNQVKSITPIGNLGPPGHTFPTDHPHIHIGEYQSGKAHPIYAPADVYITSVAWQEGITQDPVDYVIYFALCRDIVGYYNHVKTISDEVNKIIEKVECESFSTNSKGSCTKVLLDRVEEGTLLGEVGLKQGNFDFGMIDLRKKLDFIRPERYPERTQHISCAFDYYGKIMKEQFYDLIEREDGTCGHIMQDVPNTLKGNWFHESAPAENVVEWDVYLAFVNHYEVPSIQVVSIAGIFTEPSLYEFIPKQSGLVNREFSQVTADGNIYCYQSESVIREWETKPRGKIIVQLIDDETLKIEHQSGACTGKFSLRNPATYMR